MWDGDGMGMGMGRGKKKNKRGREVGKCEMWRFGLGDGIQREGLGAC